MKSKIILLLYLVPVTLFSTTFPSLNKVKSDIVSNNILEIKYISQLTESEYPWELGIVPLYNTKTKDSLIPDFFNKASRSFIYSLPTTFSISSCRVTVAYVKMKSNDNWKYYTTIAEGCPKGSIFTINQLENEKKVDTDLQLYFLNSFKSNPSNWVDVKNIIGIDSTVKIKTEYGKTKNMYSIEYNVYYSLEGLYLKRTYTTLGVLRSSSFSTVGNLEFISEKTLKELPSSLLKLKI